MSLRPILYLCVLSSALAASACSDDAGSNDDPDGGTGKDGGGSAAQGGPGSKSHAIGSASFSDQVNGCMAAGASREAFGDKLERLELGIDVRTIKQTSAGLYLLGTKTADGSNGIFRLAPGARTAPTVVVTGGSERAGLATNGTRLAWVGRPEAGDGPGVWSIALGDTPGTPIKAIEDPEQRLWYLALDEQQAFAWDFFESNLSRAPLDGSHTQGEVVSSGQSINQLTVDGDYLYYSAQPTSVFDPYPIFRRPTAGGAEELVLGSADFPQVFALTPDSIYVPGDYSFSRYERADVTQSHVIFRQELAPDNGDNRALDIAPEGDHLFFVDQLYNLGWVAADGKDCGLIVQHLVEASSSSPSVHLAVAPEGLYVAFAGSLYRVTRDVLGLTP